MPGSRSATRRQTMEVCSRTPWEVFFGGGGMGRSPRASESDRLVFGCRQSACVTMDLLLISSSDLAFPTSGRAGCATRWSVHGKSHRHTEAGFVSPVNYWPLSTAYDGVALHVWACLPMFFSPVGWVVDMVKMRWSETQSRLLGFWWLVHAAHLSRQT